MDYVHASSSLWLPIVLRVLCNGVYTRGYQAVLNSDQGLGTFLCGPYYIILTTGNKYCLWVIFNDNIIYNGTTSVPVFIPEDKMKLPERWH